MRKVLVAVMGCRLHEENGVHQVIRDTWGSDANQTLGDVRFFVGRGVGSLSDDCVLLDVPDNKETLLYKVSGICSWALQNGYDSIFKVNTSSYVNVAAVKSCDHESQDYVGASVGVVGQLYSESDAFGFIQGSASWLSAKAATIVARDAVNYALANMARLMRWNGWISPYLHSEDLWIGQVLTPYLHYLNVVNVPEYANGPLTFWSQTLHIKLYCLREWMEALHALRPDGARMIEVHQEFRRRGA